jgi:hypothetical protein
MAAALIRLAAFGTLAEAEHVRGALEAADVPAAVFGENTVGALGGTSALLPEVELHVAVADLKRARDVLHALYHAPLEPGWEEGAMIDEGLWLCPLCDEAVANAQERCRYCGTKRP